ncbi:MAG: hypothetical protein U0W24_21980 [Bacteroidales bacterium]
MIRKLFYFLLVPILISSLLIKCKIDDDIKPEDFTPILLVTVDGLNFGTSETSKTFIIQNDKNKGGNGTLNFTISENLPWLTVEPLTGEVGVTDSKTITVTVDRSGLNIGKYQGSISITSNGGSESINIDMEVIKPNEAPNPDFTISLVSNGYVNTDIRVEAKPKLDDYTDNKDLEFRWKWEANENFTSPAKGDTIRLHKYTTSGIKQITMEVKDNAGLVGTWSKDVEILPPTIPEISTGQANNQTYNTAYFTGNIIELGNGALKVTQYGHIWTTGNANTLTVDNNEGKTQLGETSIEGNFQSYLTGLIADKTYYVKAYAINDAGPSYGGIATFSTKMPEPSYPITTVYPSNITQATADISAVINSFPIGVSSASAHGFCWSKNPNPTVFDLKKDLGYISNVGVTVYYTIENLDPNSTYYVRAFMTTTAGTAYGNEIVFPTKQ